MSVHAGNELVRYMSRVGVGPRGSKDLSYDDAYAAMTAIIRGRFHPTTLGGFLQSLRFKGETPEELAGFVDALRDEAVVPCPVDLPGLIDVAGNYDGKQKTPHISVAASLVAAGAGVPVVMHDGTDVPTKQGVTKVHLLQQLGIATDRTPAQVAESLKEAGIGFLRQSTFVPALFRLLGDRIALGKRSFLNTIEPLLNPAGATVHIGGFFHLAYGERVCRALARSRAGFERIVMVQGIEGMDEVRLGRARIAELNGDEYVAYQLDSKELGLAGSLEELEEVGVDPKRSADLTVGLLSGGPVPEAFRSAVLLNAGLRLYAAGRAETAAAGIEKAVRSLTDGAALDRLERWRGVGGEPTRSTSPQKQSLVGSYTRRTGWNGPMTTYPIFLVGLERRRCMVVGGGEIAADKVSGLLKGGAGRIDVVSPAVGAETSDLIDGERVRHVPRAFAPEDLSGVFLVIAATDDVEVNRTVFAEAESRGILAQVVDDPPACTFIMPSIVRRGDLTVAISTGGASPALAARLRRRLEKELGVEYERFVELAGAIRPLIMDSIENPAIRKRLWYDIVDSDVLRLLREGKLTEARQEAIRWIGEAKLGSFKSVTEKAVR